MFIRNIDTHINKLHGVGSVASAKLAHLEINKIKDLLTYYPKDWEDRSIINPLNNYQNGKVCNIVKIIGRDWIGYGRNKTLKLYIEDNTAQGILLCFNRPWLEKQIITGKTYRIWGKFYYKYGELQSGSFEIEDANIQNTFSKILPIYPLTAGLSQAMLRRFVSRALNQYSSDIMDELPDEIIKKYNLMPKNKAIKEIHFPSTAEELEKARRTLVFEELFYLQILVGKRKINRPQRIKKNTKEDYSKLQNNLLKRLPFTLTEGQFNAVKEINLDLNSNISMARLLQGDVGSGKTLVSFLTALKIVENGNQAAIMAPTELLARQHSDNAAKLLEPLGINVAFLTGNIKTAGRKELLKNLKNGGIDIVIGTHALFSKDVEYKKLALVIIDEQHRFGVTQRSLIMSKGDNPHLLMMSATPIPRTLALTVFGDMDVSIIPDMPPGRKPVKTHLAKESSEKKVYDFVGAELEKGRQAYFVYPLIEEGDNSNDLKDAVSMTERLSKEVFPQYKTAIIHSKLTEEKKQQTMEDFRMNRIQILAATSVVEVGVDVPNAACMVVEHAERFGLSALHQLRGRVGRGTDQSYCFLVYSDDLTEDGKARLKVMLENNDGFVIAEEDLKLRGPGQITGTEQSGYLLLGISNPFRDFEQLEAARKDAFAILENDPALLLPGHRIIAKVLEEAPPFGNIVL
ncbi:MAG: ATP-dependent DNA helicase RecG [Treponema sp.]|jgi:ATP-dependent DNA helicase RecG|nr:ATP-dependent DNA helicase RecG [Treponema sp.]